MDELGESKLVGLIYEAALEPESWRHALSELARLAGADAWHLLGWDMERGADLLGLLSDELLSTSALADYNAHYGAIDPRRTLSAQSEPGAVMSCHRHFSERFVSGSEFFQDLLLPLGLRYSMGGCLRRSKATDYQVGLTRSSERGPFLAEEEALLGRLMPHFDRALRLMERGQTLEKAAEIAAAGLDATPLAVIALDCAGRMQHCNRRGEQLLQAGDVLRLCEGLLTCAEHDKQGRFASAVEICATTGHAVSLLLRHRRRPDERYSVTFTRPPDRGAFGPISQRDELLCLVAPVDRRRVATARQLMALFALSAAEARLARALAHGESLDGYALGAGLKVTTVKTQLRSIFVKTGTDRQTALIRVVLSVPGVREPE